MRTNAQVIVRQSDFKWLVWVDCDKPRRKRFWTYGQAIRHAHSLITNKDWTILVIGNYQGEEEPL